MQYGAQRTYACTSTDRLSQIFFARNLAAVANEPPLNIYRPRRFTFARDWP
jgi:hypothetical protein